MGKKIWRDLMSVFRKNGICTFPPYEKVMRFLDVILPQIQISTEVDSEVVNGVFTDVGEFQKLHLQRWLVAEGVKGVAVPPGFYFTEWKGGIDGGRHGWFRWSDGPQPEGAKTTQSIAINDLVLLKVYNAEGTPDFVWEEPFPNSEEATRVAGLLVAEEKLENVSTFVNYLQESAEAVKNGITFNYKGGEYSFVNKFSDRNDKKVSKMLTGVMFGCLSCEVPKEQWTDEELIRQGPAGFPMVRTLARVKAQCQNLPKKADGSIRREDHDFGTRLGISHAPMSKRELCVVTVTHKYIHWIQYDVKILVHLMLGHYSWIEGKDMEAAIKVKMQLVQDALRPGGGRIGIAFNMPTNGGSGGNTTTAEAARKVYQTPELRERLVALCPDQYKFVFGQILFNTNLILRLLSSNKELMVDRIQALCVAQALRYKSIGPWIEFTDTIHEGLAHMAEAIEKNGGRGLKNISEENLEKMHKVVRQLREKGARLLSMQSNLTDVFRKVNAKSDPVVRTVKPPVSCKHCHQVGHSTRGCKVLAAERNPQELSEDDVAFWSYVKPDQRPATVAGDTETNYVEEESEDNDSGEEEGIDEDMMDID